MSTLLMRMAAPLQSWGYESKFDIRQTGREPTKSGVTGFLAAALGIRRDDDEAMRRLGALRFGVRTDQEGTLIRDYQTVQDAARKRSYVTERYYLSDAVFLVGLEGDCEFIQNIRDAILAPAYPLFLGRRSCPPTGRVFLGIRPYGLEQALKREPWQAAGWLQKKRNGVATLRFSIDAPAGAAGQGYRQDLAVSLSPVSRRYARRAFVTGSVSVGDVSATGRDWLPEDESYRA